jgi:hypothetical protein
MFSHTEFMERLGETYCRQCDPEHTGVYPPYRAAVDPASPSPRASHDAKSPKSLTKFAVNRLQNEPRKSSPLLDRIQSNRIKVEWGDVILLTRLIQRKRFRELITHRTQQLLQPYDPLEILVKLRMGSARNKSERPEQPRRQSGSASVADFPTEENPLGSWDSAGADVAAWEAAGLYGFGLISQFAAIDDHVYAAMSSLAEHHIENISDLSSKLATYHHDIWGGLSQKGIDNVAGHVGEYVSADNLAHAGVHIQWPDTSNQAAWDFLTDGHQLNVKLVADFSELAKHFAEYPDVPAVIPYDTAHIPLSDHVIYLDPSHAVSQIHDAMASGKDHLVFVDQGLSHADVLAQTQDATDAALGSPDAVDFHFPFITFLRSGHRELRLLANAKTDPASALKNLGLDLGGTGAGGFMGAKAGLAAGSLLGPIGTVVGTLLGAALGAWLGRSFTNAIKHDTFKRVAEQLKSTHQQLQEKCERLESSGKRRFEEAKQSEQRQLAQQALELRQGIQVEAMSIRDWRKSEETLSDLEMQGLLKQATIDTETRLDALTSFVRGQSWWVRWIWPSPEILAYRDATRAIEAISSDLNELAAEAKSRGGIPRYELYALLGKVGLALNTVKGEIHALEVRRQKREGQLRDHIRTALEKLAQSRQCAFDHLNSLLNQLRKELQDVIELDVSAIERLSEECKKEAEKLGLA